MTAPNGTRESGTDATPAQGIILTQDQARAAQYPLLSELERLLEDAAKRVQQMRESKDLVEAWPIAYETRPLFTWIEETVDALDALGWREFVERRRKHKKEA